MKYLFLVVCLFSTTMYAQENKKEFDDFFKKLIDSIESDRKEKQDIINSYEDILCTYWTLEIDTISSDIISNLGYIFLSDRLVLRVKNSFEPIDFYDGNDKINGFNRIYGIDFLCAYEIKNDKIVFDAGVPVAYLENGYLYISYNERDFEKYRLEWKFSNYQTGINEK